MHFCQNVRAAISRLIYANSSFNCAPSRKWLLISQTNKRIRNYLFFSLLIQRKMQLWSVRVSQLKQLAGVKM